jgi:hypothetical protein
VLFHITGNRNISESVSLLAVFQVTASDIEMAGTAFNITGAENPWRKLILHKPEGTRRVGRPAIRWLDAVAKKKSEGNGR